MHVYTIDDIVIVVNLCACIHVTIDIQTSAKQIDVIFVPFKMISFISAAKHESSSLIAKSVDVKTEVHC